MKILYSCEYENRKKGAPQNIYSILLITISLIYALIFSFDKAFAFDEVKIGADVGLRYEFWNTLQKDVGGNNPYNFLLGRVRTKFDIISGNLNLRLASQGVKAFFLPQNARFGPGKIYYDLNDRKTFPGDLHLMELNIGGKIGALDFRVGRIGIKDGSEIIYKEDKKFNLVKLWRASERLIGEWEWANAGRRFDGGILGYDLGFSKISAFGARALGGGLDFDDGYNWLDLYIGGGSFSIKKNFLKEIELGLYSILYYDARRFEGKDKDIIIQTSGLRAISVQKIGSGELDFFLLGAHQLGKFLALNQSAFAFIGEIGYQFPNFMLKPWVRAGISYASGDNNPQDQIHKTFFNLLPTNHKWYGYMDIVAFSNLQNIYVQGILNFDIFEFIVDFHLFSLASISDSWYAGSGAFNNKSLGYPTPITASRVSEIGSPDLGKEIDLTLVVRYSPKFWFDIGFSRLLGGKIIKQEFTKRSNSDWFYTRLNFAF